MKTICKGSSFKKFGGREEGVIVGGACEVGEGFFLGLKAYRDKERMDISVKFNQGSRTIW